MKALSRFATVLLCFASHSARHAVTRQPRGAEVGEFMRTAVAKQLVSSPGMNISTVALGRAFKQLGFRPATVGHSRGYYVVRITPEERKQRAVSMGYDAWKQQVSAASKDTDVTDVTDVS